MNAVDRAYCRIRDGILSGELAPNTRLKETELVEFCGVSRTPVREALRRLAADDFVSVRHNYGAQVRSWTNKDIDDVFELRSLLEGYAARRAATRITEKGLISVQRAIERMDDVLSHGLSKEWKAKEFLRWNRALHEAIWEASGSERLRSILGCLVDQSLMARTIKNFTSERIATSHDHHMEVLRALTVADGVWAEATMTSHIRAARGALRQALASSSEADEMNSDQD